MTNWFSPLAIVTSKCGSDPWNDEQVITIDWILKVKQLLITVTANVYFTKTVNCLTKFLTYLWSCYSVFYKIAWTVPQEGSHIFTSKNYYKILWIMYQSIPSPIGGILHKFRQGCSFEVIFCLPENNNKLQIDLSRIPLWNWGQGWFPISVHHLTKASKVWIDVFNLKSCIVLGNN